MIPVNSMTRKIETDGNIVGGEQVLALHAEDLTVTKRQAVRTVQVRRETRRRETVVEEPLQSFGVVIEHVPIGRFVDAVPPVREEGEFTILPVVEEVVVVERRLRLVEEVRIRRVQTTNAHVETISLREQHVVVTRSDPVFSATGSSGGISADQPALSNPLRRVSMSNETIVAVYDKAAQAELAVADLLAAHVPQSAIHRHAAEGSYSPAATSVTARGPEETGGFWSSLFGGTTEETSVYDRSMVSGGNVVTVSTVPEHDYEAIMAILEKHNPIDIDERYASYQSSGLSTGTMAATSLASDAGTMGTSTTGTVGTGLMGTADTGLGMAAGGTIQLAEEQLAVGKRLINRGGTRVRRYVVETPVEQSVSLHEEKVTLERHAVTDGRAVGDMAFTDKTIELTETAEEAVVSKTARVVEEVSLGKVATDRVETIHDTLRKEEVEIEQIPGTTTTTTTTTGGTFGTTKI